MEGTPQLSDPVDLGPDHYQACLEVEHLAFGSVNTEFGITAANTPDNPAFWSREDLAAVRPKGFGLFGVLTPAGRVLGGAQAAAQG